MTDLPDSGKRVQFGEGAAMREDDSEKPAIEGLSPYALMRIGMVFTRGGVKYGNFRNWERGMPFSRYIGGILRHTAKYMMRDTTEDHLAAIVWNAQCLMHHEEVGQAQQWDDRPRWTPKGPVEESTDEFGYDINKLFPPLQ